jgi:hypothetical protein
VAPAVQLELDSARRDLVAQLQRCVRTSVTGAVVHTLRLRRPPTWQDAHLTPELSIDPGITGNAVVRADVERLKAALREQAAVLRPLVR